MRLRICVFAALAVLALGAPATAQEDEEGRFSFGVGAGMARTDGGTEPYLTGNMRFKVGYRPEGTEREGGIMGFIEPEVGYWTSDEDRVERSDLLVGVNVGGVVKLRVFEYFVGAGVGYHFLDAELTTASGARIASDEGVLGFNTHFGFDVRMSEMVSIYGVGRFDLIDDDGIEDLPAADQQTKAYLGLRFRM